MKFARHGSRGAEKPIVCDADGRWRDLTPVAGDVTPDVLTRPESEFGLESLPVVTRLERFGPPLAGVGKIVCIGLNYRDHAEETGAVPPAEPIVFLKAPDTIVGPDDDVLIPRGSRKTDWEVELALVIGAKARYLDGPESALACVAGYTISNDVSEREFQLERGGQWDKGKNCETFNPLGPWILTADEVPDPQKLDLRLWVNGQVRQDGTTADMIFNVAYLVWHLSQFMVLNPGDVINTGTPAGVALGSPGLPYLRAGDVVELEIDGLGRQRQNFKAAH
ncbi:2-hydroxyhepta-2,4-diene-1,7-dioate isomerase [Planotetraspora silvatica]|uniref:2-hydroxyhepta-2,4-diene-1,7-dioate isomerase n=1 Tax=Planotetraspora silvatica TaxID=234614 RepID=A0A8J3XVM2_9ACTN|nr:fumarylacetoacetate hydrolase family protein [Planotetraspora silvatica]GII50748.1 2-hydroxyhepta-2,4-diene-1,7-dioate isomerase [Planotetraspora silvatica]